MRRPIITLEDGTEVLKTTGDVDAFAHGGGVLYRAPGRGGIFWTFWDARELGQKVFYVYTAPIPADILEYFEPDLKEMSLVLGLELRELKKLSASKSPFERLELVQAIQECFGSSRVDPESEPELMSLHDLSEQWGPVFGVDPSKVPKLSYDDYVVRETEQEEYECGSVDGVYLGRHAEYKTALCAVADHMRETSRVDANLYHEYEHGKLELVAWDHSTFTGKIPKRRGKLPVARWQNCMKQYVTSEIVKKSIDSQASGQRNVTKGRELAKAKILSADRLRRAKDIRRSMEEIY